MIGNPFNLYFLFGTWEFNRKSYFYVHYGWWGNAHIVLMPIFYILMEICCQLDGNLASKERSEPVPTVVAGRALLRPMREGGNSHCVHEWTQLPCLLGLCVLYPTVYTHSFHLTSVFCLSSVHFCLKAPFPQHPGQLWSDVSMETNWSQVILVRVGISHSHLRSDKGTKTFLSVVS